MKKLSPRSTQCTPLHSSVISFFLSKFSQICDILGKKTAKNSAKNSAIFNENFEIRDRCKGVHCVDLGESFPTHIYLQNLASIQPRTSLVKFARSPRTDPPGLQRMQAVEGGCGGVAHLRAADGQQSISPRS